MKNAVRIAMTAVMMLLILAAPIRAYGAAAGNHDGGIVKVSGDIYVNEGTTVDGDVVTVWGNIYINGTVTGNAVTVFGNIVVNGKVMGDATTVQGKITEGQNGKILGDTVEAFDRSLPANKFRGAIPNMNLPFWFGIGSLAISVVFSLIALLLFSLVYLIMPAKIDDMADTIEENLGKRIGIGFLGIIGSPIAMILLTILLAITVIGIIVIPFLWIAYMVAGLIALVPVYAYIGSKVGEIVGKQKIKGYGALAAGILFVWLVKAILSFGGVFTSWMNAIISLILFVLGAGTLLDYIFSGRKPRPVYAASHMQGGGQSFTDWNMNNTSSAGSENNIKNDTPADGEK